MTMKKIKSLFCIGLCAALTACASLNSTVFQAENLAADAATDATHAFNQYYHSATNNLADKALANLESTRTQVYAADEKLSDYLATLDGLRLAYNSGGTNKAAVLNALVAVQSQSTNIVVLIKPFLPQK